VAQGDSDFRKAHLHGWRQAESFYKKAYGLEPSDATRDKLVLTCFLILTREIDEDITDPAMEGTFGDLCSSRLTARQKVLCDVAGRYRIGSAIHPADQKEPPDGAHFDLEHSPLDAYLYALYLQTHGIKETNEIAGARAERFKDSPLFLYLYMGKKISLRAEELEREFPDFAELSDFMGGVQFQNHGTVRLRLTSRKPSS
jgi:hypothetical protein